MTIRVLIVDDSALMRRHLRTLLEDAGDFAVETARNGREAMDRIGAFEPHVVTLDVNMPEMDGLACLGAIMEERPTPVVMVSQLTREGADETVEALQLGAVDFVEKPGGRVSRQLDALRGEMIAKIVAAARARPRRGRTARARVRAAREAARHRPGRSLAAERRAARQLRLDRTQVPGIVLVGVSTGGPQTLEEILSRLPEGLGWPVVVAQHMPGHFTAVFARRLAGLCPLPVVEVDRPMPLEPGVVYVAHGGGDLEIRRRFDRLVAKPEPQDPAFPYHPSVDRLVRSAREIVPAERLVGILLTGMGRDGAEEMAALHRDGGRTIAEAEESAVIFGMPAALIEARGATAVVPSTGVADQLLSWIG